METLNYNSKETHQLYKGRRIALTSSILILFLALLKAIVGYRFNSDLLIADAFHSGADILINFTSWVGLLLASKKKSIRFPYGLYRAETLACLLIGIGIIFIGFDLFRDGLEKIFQPVPTIGFPLFPIGAAAISCVISTVLAVEQRAVGKEIGSHALLATSREAFYDIFTSLFVLAGILMVFFRVPYVEGTVIVIIAIFIIKLGIETSGTSLMILMDANLDVALQIEIEEKINRIYGVKGVTDVKIRQSGPFKMIECVVRTAPTLPLYKAHEMSEEIEDMLYNDYKNIESAFIHIEPDKRQTELAIIPVQNIDGLQSKLHGHFGRAPYFILLKITGNQIEIEDFFLNEFLEEKGHVGLNVVKTIINYKIDLLFVAGIGEIAFHMLKNNMVDIYKTDAGTSVSEVITMYRQKQILLLKNPTHTIEKSQVVKSKQLGEGF